MKRGAAVIVLILCLTLAGCGTVFDGEYAWVQTHPIPVLPGDNQDVSAKNYQQLCGALEAMIEKGTEQATISVEHYDRQQLEADLQQAISAVHMEHPIAAYAVESISCEVGTSGGVMALAVKITYIHDKSEIRQILHVVDNTQAEAAIHRALDACDTGIVLLINQYAQADFAQIVENYALEHPETVMENPQVTENVYPETGESRVVELKFSYQTSREALKNMQQQVAPVFESAALYVSGDGAASEKYAQLYSFLTERYDYKIETSITPAYSLLRHGVGDSKAFAAVYASMCRQAGLECFMVSGTREGEPWYWNIVGYDDVYYHVDLLRCSENGFFVGKFDEEMAGYVWDFDAYPACISKAVEEPVPDETTPLE